MMLPVLRSKALMITALIAAVQITAPSLAHAQNQGKNSTTPASPTVAEPPVAKPAPYDGDLARLSEIMGALQYIEVLCKNTASNDWRGDMSKLLAAEAINEPQRQERFTAAYNRGYRSFAAVHSHCTSNAKAAEKTYRHEGATLAQEITSRFGN